jgi:uncharacterized membrane protein
MIATKSRSLVKTITWRFLGSLDTFLLSWLITGKAKLALSIASVEVLTKLILYYWHERVWNLIKWGRKN